MSTAANQPPQANRPQAVPPKRDMVESKAPEQFKFDRIGQDIQGVLISIEPVQVKGKPAIEYMFQNEQNGARLTILGTNDLNKKLLAHHIGHFVQIRYENDDASIVQQGQSPMKMFHVSVAKNVEPGFEKLAG